MFQILSVSSDMFVMNTYLTVRVFFTFCSNMHLVMMMAMMVMMMMMRYDRFISYYSWPKETVTFFLLLCIVAVDYVRIILIIVTSAFFHAQPSVSLTLYILSVCLDGQCLVFSVLNTKYFIFSHAVQWSATFAVRMSVRLSDPCLNGSLHFTPYDRGICLVSWRQILQSWI